MATEKDVLGTVLQRQLDEHREKSRARFPPEAAAIVRQTTEELARSGIVERSLPVGAQAPDFALPNARGETVALSSLRARGPVVIAFYRGLW